MNGIELNFKFYKNIVPDYTVNISIGGEEIFFSDNYDRNFFA